MMNIREATEKDFDQIWPILHEIVSAGDTYAFPVETTKQQALIIWLKTPIKTFVAIEDNNILATYYIKTNQADIKHKSSFNKKFNLTQKIRHFVFFFFFKYKYVFFDKLHFETKWPLNLK